MNKYQISTLALAISSLSLVLPIKLFFVLGGIAEILLLWMIKRSMTNKYNKYDSVLFLIIAISTVLGGIFVYYVPAFSIFNFFFFSSACLMSLQIKHNSNRLVKKTNNTRVKLDMQFVELRKNEIKKEDALIHIIDSGSKSLISNSDQTPVKVDYDRLINELKKDLREQIDIRLMKATNEMAAQINTTQTKQFAKEQENLLEGVKSSLIGEIGKSIEIALQNQTLSFKDEQNKEEREILIRKQIEDELKTKYEQEIDSTKSLFLDLKIAIEQYGKSVEYVKNQISSINEKDPNQPHQKIYEELIRKLQDERVNFSNNRHLMNREIKDIFHHALENAEEEVCIISPWLGSWILSDRNDLMERFRSLLKRKVRLKIAYGISSHSYQKEDSRNLLTEKVANELQKKFKKYGDLFQIQKVNSHHKLLICDNSYYVQGSYNLLSNKGNFEEPSMWHEGAEYSEDPIMIGKLKKLYFNW
ncbi:phospholipase D-like domain-containing protein [Litchfieldia alkalitelluris]|uniref:phospholipase D-like domain-containing protein n=1 Tax=Litchfieldia alkalitelluris TaxID=304268 RepID=UPI000996399F|nr:phospholipase D-like domain-containing protein [Litchfieldia alkalitelluris]